MAVVALGEGGGLGGAAVVASSVVLFVIVVDVRGAVVGDVAGADVELAIQEGAELTEFVQNNQDGGSRALRVAHNVGQART